jgi:hypothetical protein
VVPSTGLIPSPTGQPGLSASPRLGHEHRPFSYDWQTCRDLDALTAAIGLLPNAIRIDHRTCFETFDVPGPPPLTSIPPQHRTLSSDCPDVDAGQILPNINDDFTGVHGGTTT